MNPQQIEKAAREDGQDLGKDYAFAAALLAFTAAFLRLM